MRPGPVRSWAGLFQVFNQPEADVLRQGNAFYTVSLAGRVATAPGVNASRRFWAGFSIASVAPAVVKRSKRYRFWKCVGMRRV